MRALITGAASGIGSATANILAEEALARGGRASLCLVDIAEAPLAEQAQRLREGGVEVATAVADVRDPDAAGRLADLASSSMGGLDALISNAGVFGRTSMLELPIEDWARTFDINTRATWLLARACHPLLKTGGGAIVATASLAAEEPTPNTGAYSPSKSALVSLVEQLALEWGPDGVRCNCVSPGTVHTGMTQAVYARDGEAEKRGALLPLRRVGRPEDVARAIAFLAGPASAYVTGVNLPVDGGLRLSVMTHFWRLANA